MKPYQNRDGKEIQFQWNSVSSGETNYGVETHFLRIWQSLSKVLSCLPAQAVT